MLRTGRKNRNIKKPRRHSVSSLLLTHSAAADDDATTEHTHKQPLSFSDSFEISIIYPPNHLSLKVKRRIVVVILIHTLDEKIVRCYNIWCDVRSKVRTGKKRRREHEEDNEYRDDVNGDIHGMNSIGGPYPIGRLPSTTIKPKQ